FRQKPRISSRIGDQLVTLIKLLSDLKCSSRRKTETTIGLPLQRSEIVQQRGSLSRRLLFLRDRPGFTDDFGLDRLGLFHRPNPLCSAIFVRILGKPFVEPTSTISSFANLKVSK